jgi:membrane associated rhomboid family serine protease
LLPLKDSPVTRRFPFINIALIIANVLVFFQQLAMTENQLQATVLAHGLIPVRLFESLAFGDLASAVAPLFSYQFLHGGWLHIGSNMLYLWVFGDNIEDRLGHLRYLIFYLVTGALAGIAQAFTGAASTVPVIGASGAVAGVLGAYLVSCPRARVLALVPVFFVLTLAEIPAVIFLGFWFILQLFSGVASIGMDFPVAWWAHIGGFVAGLLLINVFGKRVDCG